MMGRFVLEKDHNAELKDDPRLISFTNFGAHLSVCTENVLYK